MISVDPLLIISKTSLKSLNLEPRTQKLVTNLRNRILQSLSITKRRTSMEIFYYTQYSITALISNVFPFILRTSGNNLLDSKLNFHDSPDFYCFC